MSEEQYNETVKRQSQEQENNYFADIEHNKNAIWDRIENWLEKKKIIPIWMYASAAVILLLFALSFIFNQQLKERNIEIANLKTQLELKKTQLEITNIKPIYKPNNSGSVNYVNEKIVYLPVQLVDTIILHDTINNLVLKTDTIFINEKADEQIAKKETIKNESLIDNKNIAVNQVTKEKKRERRFIFQFGKPKNEQPTNETQSYETKGLITLKSK